MKKTRRIFFILFCLLFIFCGCGGGGSSCAMTYVEVQLELKDDLRDAVAECSGGEGWYGVCLALANRTFSLGMGMAEIEYNNCRGIGGYT